MESLKRLVQTKDVYPDFYHGRGILLDICLATSTVLELNGTFSPMKSSLKTILRPCYWYGSVGFSTNGNKLPKDFSCLFQVILGFVSMFDATFYAFTRKLSCSHRIGVVTFDVRGTNAPFAIKPETRSRVPEEPRCGEGRPLSVHPLSIEICSPVGTVHWVRGRSASLPRPSPLREHRRRLRRPARPGRPLPPMAPFAAPRTLSAVGPHA